jgi:hypothetical protein
MAEHGDVAPQLEYRTNVRCRWLLGDFIHLLKVWSGAPAGYPGTYPTRLGTLLKLMVPVPGTMHDNFTFDDPLPEIADWITVGALQKAIDERQNQFKSSRCVAAG